MRKATTIFLLLLLGLNSIGLYPIFKLVQLHTKELAEHIIRQGVTSDLVVFANLNNNKQVIWEEENKEFSYEGKRYDIVKEEEEEGNLLFYCYDDKKETNISNRIDVLVDKQLANGTNPPQDTVLHIMIMLAQVFIPTETYTVKANLINDDLKCTHHFVTTHYPVCILDIPIPPPWA